MSRIGRPPLDRDTVQTSLRMDRGLLAELDVATEERGVSCTYLIAHLVREGLGRLILPEEIVLTREES